MTIVDLLICTRGKNDSGRRPESFFPLVHFCWRAGSSWKDLFVF